MSDYIHPNDPRNPDWLPPVTPSGAAERLSPVEAALSARELPHYRITDSFVVCRGLFIALWPSREGTYGIAAGAPQYAQRRHEGWHDSSTSVDALMQHPYLQKSMPRPDGYIGEGWG